MLFVWLRPLKLWNEQPRYDAVFTIIRPSDWQFQRAMRTAQDYCCTGLWNNVPCSVRDCGAFHDCGYVFGYDSRIWTCPASVVMGAKLVVGAAIPCGAFHFVIASWPFCAVTAGQYRERQCFTNDPICNSGISPVVSVVLALEPINSGGEDQSFSAPPVLTAKRKR